MAKKGGDIFFRLLGDDSHLAKSLFRAKSKIISFASSVGSKLKGAVSGLGEAAGIGGLGGGLGIAGLLGYSLTEADKAEKVSKQLNRVIQTTGNAAKVTAADLLGYAQALQWTTGVDDEAIAKTEAFLLTFTKLSGPIVKDATEAVLNMSAVMGTDFQAAAIQVGKALNDPINGITSLKRVGVSLDAEQTEMIARLLGSSTEMKKLGTSATHASKGYSKLSLDLQEAKQKLNQMSHSSKTSRIDLLQQRQTVHDLSAKMREAQGAIISHRLSQDADVLAGSRANRMMKAQQIILAELKKEFGGQAAEAATTLSGRLSILRVAFGELAQGIGAQLLPYAERFVTWLSDIVKTNSDKWIANFAEWVKYLGDNAPAWFETIKTEMGKMVDVLPTWEQFRNILSDIGLNFPNMIAALKTIADLIVAIATGMAQIASLKSAITGGVLSDTISEIFNPGSPTQGTTYGGPPGKMEAAKQRMQQAKQRQQRQFAEAAAATYKPGDVYLTISHGEFHPGDDLLRRWGMQQSNMPGVL